TFTREGTWRAAAEQLPELARIGITVVEMMPVAEFPGRFGWGYDGVDLFAPSHLYGTPDDLRGFIDRAHSLGLGVILDVVYNHFGPDGNYLGVFSDDYLIRGKGHEWGDVINFDGPSSGPVREFFITNGRYWIEEFHFDGFRFDATHAIRDESEEYIIGAVGRAAREAAGSRSIILIAENDLQEAKMIRPPSKGGDGLDGMWNDDFHHGAIVAMTGNNVGYYCDYSGNPQEFISAAKYGFLYQGQALSWRQISRGTPTPGVPAEDFVCFIENHDQIANTGLGKQPRFQTSRGCYRAMTALLLLGPWTPLLFQGQEFGASSPFLYFADVGDESVRDATRRGRAQLLAPFLTLTEEETMRRLAAPDDPEAFARCKLDLSERDKNRELYDLHIDLLKLRTEDSRFRQQGSGGIDGAVLGPASFVLRYFSEDNNDRLLIVNFGVLTLLCALSLAALVRAQEMPAPTPPPKVYPVALPNYDEDTATRLQIFLDNNDFGPGKIDGRMGEFFRKALISYKHAHAMLKTGAVDQWMLDQVPVTYTTYTIKEEDLKQVGDVPGSRDEQAKLKWLPYTSLLEFVA